MPTSSSRLRILPGDVMADTLRNIFRRLQDGVGELGDALLGDRAERALDQEIRDIDRALHDARADEAEIKVRRVRAENLAAELRQSRGGLEDEVAALLRRRRRTAAREQAARLVEIDERIAEFDLQATEARRSEQQIHHLIEQLEHRLRRAKHQVGTLRAAASIERAQAAVARRGTVDAQHPESALAPANRLRNRGGAGGTRETGEKSNKVSTPREQAIDQAMERLAAKAGKRPARRTRPKTGTGKAR